MSGSVLRIHVVDEVALVHVGFVGSLCLSPQLNAHRPASIQVHTYAATHTHVVSALLALLVSLQSPVCGL